MAIQFLNPGPPTNLQVKGDRLVLLATATPPSSPVASPVISATVSNAILQLACGSTSGGPVGNIGRMLDPLSKGVKDAGGATFLPVGTVLTLGQARTLFMGDGVIGGFTTTTQWPRCRSRITPRAGSFVAGTVARQRFTWALDWAVDASGRPTLVVSASYNRFGITTAIDSPSGTSPMAAIIEVEFCPSNDAR